MTNENGNKARAIEQAQTGYKNAQDLIRFIDTKSSFLTGGSVLCLGFAFQLLKYIRELPTQQQVQLTKFFQDCPLCSMCMQSLGVLSLLFGVLCVWSCVFSLVGRNPIHIRHSLLFPFFSGTAAEHTYCQKVAVGMTEAEVAEEYKNQIFNIGIILQRKIKRHRWAAWMFLVQIAVLTTAGIVFIAFWNLRT
jgi:hypothetical protein